MSRFFKETRKAQELALQEAQPPAAGVDPVRETLTSTSVAQELADERLGRCRKVRLVANGQMPVVMLQEDKATIAAVESYRSLRTRLSWIQAKDGLRSLVISSASQGDGKTFTAANLALCFAQLQDARILLVDADLRTRGLSRLLGCPDSPGLAGVLAGSGPFEQAVMATDRPNLYLAAAGTPPSVHPSELFASPRWKEFIGWSSECFKLIVVDSPPILPMADFELIAGPVEGVVVVVRALSTEREVLKKAVRVIDAKKIVGIVLNAAGNGRAERRSYAYYAGDTQKK